MDKLCEDFPCCGHGPAPLGDGGGCPDEQGRFRCVICQGKMPKGATSAICADCRHGRSRTAATRERRYPLQWEDAD